MILSRLTFIIIATVAATFCSTYAEPINVSNSSSDYYFLAQRDLLNDCDLSEVEIASVNARYADELSVIHLQQQSILDEIQSVNKTYTELQALNIRKKHCIQKNLSQFVTQSSASSRFATCYDAASKLASTLTKSADTDLTSARNAVLVTFPKSYKACNTANPLDENKMEECYVKEVNTATNNCNKYLANVRVDLNKSLYDASVAISAATKCSFAVEMDVLVSMGKAQEAIQYCEETFSQVVYKEGERGALYSPSVALRRLIRQ